MSKHTSRTLDRLRQLRGTRGQIQDALIDALEEMVTDPRANVPAGWCAFPASIRDGRLIPWNEQTKLCYRKACKAVFNSNEGCPEGQWWWQAFFFDDAPPPFRGV